MKIEDLTFSDIGRKVLFPFEGLEHEGVLKGFSRDGLLIVERRVTLQNAGRCATGKRRTVASYCTVEADTTRFKE